MRKPFRMCAVSSVTAVFLVLSLSIVAHVEEYPFQRRADPPQRQFSRQELAQLTAPIALYPDELVAQILVASTYPLEIVEADRWARENRDIKGDNLADALDGKNWDPSVKSLITFPSVLSMMSLKLEVTSKLGDAFLNQEKDVMDTVQALRKRAYDAGALTATPEQQVVIEEDTIVIQSTNPQVIYVPTYDAAVVYGPWMYPDYPPYLYYAYPPPVNKTFAFGVRIVPGFAWGYAWGGCNWRGGSVHINVWRNASIRNPRINRAAYQRYYQSRGVVGHDGQGTWRHDVLHRRGVAYRYPATARQYGQSPTHFPQVGRGARGYGDDRGMAPPPTTTGTAPGPRNRWGVDRVGAPPGNIPRVPGQAPATGKSDSVPGGKEASDRTGGGISGGRYSVQPPRETKAGVDRSGPEGGSGSPAGGRGGVRFGAGKGAAPTEARDSVFDRAYGDGPGDRAAGDRGQASRRKAEDETRKGNSGAGSRR